MPPRVPLPPISAEPSLVTITKNLKEMWPFAVGFATTGYIFVKIAMGVSDEDVKNSKFTNPRH